MTRPHRQRGRRRRTVVIVVVVLAVVAVGVVVGVRFDRPAATGLAGAATVTASSSSLGSSPRNTVLAGSASPVDGWRSDHETAGAWLELQWGQPHVLRQFLIERDRLDQPGITDGYLSFGDGSFLQVTLSATDPTTTVDFAARSVNRVRFTVSKTDDDARSVAVMRLAVSEDPGAVTVASPPATGDAAPLATITRSGPAAPDTAEALIDGKGSDLGEIWSADPGAGAWTELTWSRPRELTSVEIVGAAGPATLRSATIIFGDGGRLAVGAVGAQARHPTVVSFMPRVVTSLRLTVDTVEGSGALNLAELRVFDRGTTAYRSSQRPVGTTTSVSPASSCTTVGASGSGAGLRVLCPTTGTAVDDSARMVVAAPAGVTRVTATPWSAAGTTAPPVTGAVSSGRVALVIDLGALPGGPVTVEVTAAGRRVDPVYFQLFHTSGDRPGRSADAGPGQGRTLAYAEEFDRPLTLSRTGDGADYAAAKPTDGGAEDFGSGIFADPAKGFGSVAVVDDDYLRLQVTPRPADFADPQGWKREHLAGLLASARAGGSGFSAQYGYFEARMLAPAAPGTWPAFWLLPAPNLVEPQPAVAEVDAIELYGHEPTGGCNTSHEYRDGKDGGVARCGERFDSARDALTWHTYGVAVSPTSIRYYIDGEAVAGAPQVAGGDDPLFFLVDLALGGGWPIELGAVQDRADLYVDYIRVYV